MLVVTYAIFQALSNYIIKKARNLTFFLIRVRLDCLVNQKTAHLGGLFRPKSFSLTATASLCQLVFNNTCNVDDGAIATVKV